MPATRRHTIGTRISFNEEESDGAVDEASETDLYKTLAAQSEIQKCIYSVDVYLA